MAYFLIASAVIFHLIIMAGIGAELCKIAFELKKLREERKRNG